ncbi:MAG: two-component system chemotaxis response regulator CheY [Candidatus Azotimanducaceae bacterium]|jgi:two-component system chemotaxis response regulator CheY
MSRLPIEELSILLLEPSLTQRKIIASKLRAVGNDNVELVADPDAAWRSMCALTPDLVISSMYFDKGTGSELLTRMRASDHLNEVLFMLISSENRFERLDPVKQAGVMAILPKPFSIDDMRVALEATAEYATYDDEDDGRFDGDSCKVLVVDDSVTSRNHISRLLINMGMENITLARDGLEAVKILEDTLFDIVITDFNMPEMDGERLTSYIRNHSSQSSIPILMVTSEVNEARLDSVMKSGVSAICDKPFNASHVKNLLSQLLR